MAVGREVLGRNALARANVTIPEWGGDALVRELSSAEIEIVRGAAGKSLTESKSIDTNALGNFERLLVRFGWINDDGSQVLSDGDIDLLKFESARIVNLMAAKIATISGLNPDAIDDAKKN